MNQPDSIGIAVLGAGRRGALHAANVARALPGAHLVGVADVDAAVAERAMRAAGSGRATTEHRDLLADPAAVAVVIATPTGTHTTLMREAAAAGKHIFCEKPIALSLEDADRALAAVAEAGVFLQIGHMRRFDPAYVEARRLIEEGRIGRPIVFRSVSLDSGISPSRDFLTRRGGIFLDVALHDFDLARWLMADEMVEVQATGAVLLHQILREVSDVDTAFTTLRFASGAIGMVQTSHTAAYGYDIATQVTGERGEVRGGDLRRSDIWRYDAQGRVSHDVWPNFPERFAVAYLQELVEFVACVREGRPSPMSGANARAALAIAIAARQSLQEGRTVRVASAR